MTVTKIRCGFSRGALEASKILEVISEDIGPSVILA